MIELISGEMVFPDNTPHFNGAQVNIMLEDVGRMDGPAEVLLKKQMPGVRYEGEPLYFVLEGAKPDGSGEYNVRVHVSLSGDNLINKGDYITKNRYQVLQDTAIDSVTVRMEKV